MCISNYLKLIRPWQYYKNLLIFLPLIFVKELFSIGAVSRVLVGFVALCMISSANYILNDIIDRKKDIMHPEKKYRPLASGIVSVGSALILAILCFVFSAWIAVWLGNYFVYFVLALFVLTLFYSYALKDIPFLDITLIGVNFILRAMSGAFIVYTGKIIPISPWLILCPFFLALFLAVGKRNADIKLLGAKAYLHKKILRYYTPGLTDSLMTITTTSLLICYALFSFNSDFPNLIYTLPFAVYIMFRYIYLVNSGSEIARNTHLLVKDIPIVVAGLIWAVVLLGIIYLF
jgi:4-hydroxybenzoate polyprenyltransferase